MLDLNFVVYFGGNNISRNFDHVRVFQPIFDDRKDAYYAESKELQAFD